LGRTILTDSKKKLFLGMDYQITKTKKEVIAPEICVGAEFVPAVNTIDRNHILADWYLDKI